MEVECEVVGGDDEAETGPVDGAELHEVDSILGHAIQDDKSMIFQVACDTRTVWVKADLLPGCAALLDEAGAPARAIPSRRRSSSHRLPRARVEGACVRESFRGERCRA